ncbi:endonuclease/exonuclease/phosphatase family protein, partial [Cooperia oncophora]
NEWQEDEEVLVKTFSQPVQARPALRRHAQEELSLLGNSPVVIPRGADQNNETTSFPNICPTEYCDPETSRCFLLINARSIVNKIPDLYFLLRQMPRAVFVTESWCKPNSIHDATLSYDSRYESCGGVLALIHKDVPHSFLIEKDFGTSIQALALEFDTRDGKLIVVLAYRSPSCSSVTFSEFIAFLQELLEEFSGHIIILGDFNFPLIDWVTMTHRGNISTTSSLSFLTFAKSFGLEQMVTSPTHGLNILDIVLVSDPRILEGMCILPPFSTSDHNGIGFNIAGFHPISAHSNKYRCFSRCDYGSVISALSKIDWVALNSASCDSNMFYTELLNICHSLIDEHVPLCMSSSKKADKFPKRVYFLHSQIKRLHSRSSESNRKLATYTRRLKRALLRHPITSGKEISTVQE